ncbi:MAG: threonylcarbamoyl-AMP synthase [Bryobacterales bacterium]|nr:threonylcarbamoyl-AMP synthase [Acidobacteriota bacterium]MCB9384970.1 threonylcarbamoyl-AMP synthase [Bryobacterales bacterium]
MRTKLIEIDAKQPDAAALDAAAEAIKAGKVVAAPSDTLYVLFADPFSLNAVSSAFRAKGRELTRSLPILVDSMTMAEDYAASPLSPRFYLLARRFWPGPLTIIMPSSTLLPLKVTGNTGRLAVRQSASAVANGLIGRLGTPVIATSANRSGAPTCRSGIEALGSMDGRIDLILDGGEVDGLGATTVDITEPEWKLIKEGGVSQAQLEDCLNAM